MGNSTFSLGINANAVNNVSLYLNTESEAKTSNKGIYSIADSTTSFNINTLLVLSIIAAATRADITPIQQALNKQPAF